MNFLSIEKLWTENDIVFNMIVIIGYMSSVDNIEDFDINYNSCYLRCQILQMQFSD
jgi:hypothetical protein